MTCRVPSVIMPLILGFAQPRELAEWAVVAKRFGAMTDPYWRREFVHVAKGWLVRKSYSDPMPIDHKLEHKVGFARSAHLEKAGLASLESKGDYSLCRKVGESCRNWRDRYAVLSMLVVHIKTRRKVADRCRLQSTHLIGALLESFPKAGKDLLLFVSTVLRPLDCLRSNIRCDWLGEWTENEHFDALPILDLLSHSLKGERKPATDTTTVRPVDIEDCSNLSDLCKSILTTARAIYDFSRNGVFPHEDCPYRFHEYAILAYARSLLTANGDLHVLSSIICVDRHHYFARNVPKYCAHAMYAALVPHAQSTGLKSAAGNLKRARHGSEGIALDSKDSDSKKFPSVDSKGEGIDVKSVCNDESRAQLTCLRDAIQMHGRDVSASYAKGYANDPFVVRIVCDIIDFVSGETKPVVAHVSSSAIEEEKALVPTFWNRSSPISSQDLLKFWIDMLIAGARARHEDSEENPWHASSDDKDDSASTDQSLRPRTERDLRMGPRTWNGALAFFERLGDILSQVVAPVRIRLLSSVGSQLASIFESNRYIKGKDWEEKSEVLWCRAAYALLCLRGVTEQWEPKDLNAELQGVPWRIVVPEVPADSRTRHALWAHSACIHLRSDIRWLLEWKIALREKSFNVRQAEAKKMGEEAYGAIYEALKKLGEDAAKRGEHWHVLLDECPGVCHVTGYARYSRIFVRIQDVGDQVRKKRFAAGKKRAQKNMTEFETRKAAAAAERRASQERALTAPAQNVILLGYSSWSDRVLSWQELSLLRDDGPATEPEPEIDPLTGRRGRAHGYDRLKSRLEAGGRRRLLFALVIEISHLGAVVCLRDKRTAQLEECDAWYIDSGWQHDEGWDEGPHANPRYDDNAKLPLEASARELILKTLAQLEVDVITETARKQSIPGLSRKRDGNEATAGLLLGEDILFESSYGEYAIEGSHAGIGALPDDS
jgi:hypothetical protein